ncbi:MAG: hypothetical protein IJ905_03390, partial [Fibrobacter sp.]|nr:hypothetical protein [Fibrobacter sp.]
GWRNDAVKQAADLIPNGHLISAQGCPALKETSYTLHFTRDGYQTFGERYADKMLEILKSQEPPPDTSKKDTVAIEKYKDKIDTLKTDSSSSDTTAKDSTDAIRNLPRLQTAEMQSPKLYFDNREQTLYVRFKKNGKEYRYRISGRFE